MKDEQAYLKAEKKILEDEKKADKKRIADAKVLAAQKIIDDKALVKAEKEAKKVLAKQARGVALSAAQQKILDDKVARDAETARLAQEVADKLTAKKALAANLSGLLSIGQSNAQAKKTLAAQREADRLLQIETDRLAEEARLAALETAKTNFKLGKNANIAMTTSMIKQAEKLETARVEAERVAEEARLATEEESRVDKIVKKMRQPGYTAPTTDTKYNNPRLRQLAEAKIKAQDITAAAAAPAAASSPPAKRGPGRPPKGKGSGFDQVTVQEVGGGFNKSTLPYGARMMIERYDNEKRLRKNV